MDNSTSSADRMHIHTCTDPLEIVCDTRSSNLVRNATAEKVGLPSSPPYLSLFLSSASGISYLSGVSFTFVGAGILNPTNPLDVRIMPYMIYVPTILGKK